MLGSSPFFAQDKNCLDDIAQRAVSAAADAGRIWIDLDNSPHVPFFAPIIKELNARGYSVVLTARDAFQVKQLLRLYRLDCECIGHHYGKNRFLKMFGIFSRALQLLPSVVSKKPSLAVSHGSRAQLVLATALRIPTIYIGDYEFATGWALIRPTWVMVPEVIPDETINVRKDRILKYPGIKEDVYVPGFTPDPNIRGQLGFCPEDIVVTIRPPASEAHYHNPHSDELFHALLDFLGQDSRVKMIVLPRNERQSLFIRNTWPNLFDSGRATIPSEVVDGMNLIWFSDLVVSGGGTMNREAAALGVPVYSIFRGPTGAVDRYLANMGCLVMLETVADVCTKLRLVRRSRPAAPEHASRPALQAIVSHIVEATT